MVCACADACEYFFHVPFYQMEQNTIQIKLLQLLVVWSLRFSKIGLNIALIVAIRNTICLLFINKY